MVAADKLGITSVTSQCCSVVDQCPLDRVLQIISDASDIGLNDLAVLDSKVSCVVSGNTFAIHCSRSRGT